MIAPVRFFADKPEVLIDILFYPVAGRRFGVPPTPFVSRHWDIRNKSVDPLGIGVLWQQARPYYGALPPVNPRPLLGTRKQWLDGLDYQTYISGGYAPGAPCHPLATGPRIRLRQSLNIQLRPVESHTPLRQDQLVSVTPVSDIPRILVAQSERVDVQPVPAVLVRQAEALQVVGLPLGPAAVRQAEDVEVMPFGLAPARLRQAQTVEALAVEVGIVDVQQAQQVEAIPVPVELVDVQQAQRVPVRPVPVQLLAVQQEQQLYARPEDDVLLYSFDASNVSAIDVVGLTGFDAYRIVGWGFQVVAMISSSLWLRTSSNGGASFDSGGTDYTGSFGSAAQLTVLQTLPDNAAVSKVGAFVLELPGFGGAEYKLLTWAGLWVTGGFIGTSTGSNGAGSRNSATAMNAVRLLAQSGSNINGHVRAYGLR